MHIFILQYFSGILLHFSFEGGDLITLAKLAPLKPAGKSWKGNDLGL